MNKKEEQVIITRIDRFIDRLADRIPGESVTFEVEYSWRGEVYEPFLPKTEKQYQPIFEGDVWGQKWETAWFHLRGSVPEDWRGNKVVARLDFSGEGLVLSGDDRILQGISNGSVFKEEFARDIVSLFDACEGGEAVELWIEAAANGLFGVFTEPDPADDAPLRYGQYEAKVNAAKFCIFNNDAWALWLDLKILAGLISALPEKSVRRAKVVEGVNRALNVVTDEPDSLVYCRDIIKPLLQQPAAASDLIVTAIGHAHIDTAWLWPMSETVRKCARTFASQLDLIERYPDYIFGASQPQHYAFVKDNYPDLYKRIKQAVKRDQWEPQGGMWVEADCNIPNGESLVRQILHGKNFFKDEFDIDIDHLWLPDVFGYSAALPQILKNSGIRYFLTQKLSWNQINEFPYHTFRWRGIDGSEVICHFPPENTYNSLLTSDSLIKGQANFKEKGVLDEFMSLYGVGDGGGGPKAEHIEYGLRQQNLEGSPKVRFGKAVDFFGRLQDKERLLPIWTDELYFELHRGTLTSQAKVKRLNRKAEQLLRQVEMLWSSVLLKHYPVDDFDRIWKTLLKNQFHDILPGSSITKVYEDTVRELEEVLEATNQLLKGALTHLSAKDEGALVLFNSTAYDWDGSLKLPTGNEDFQLVYGDGAPVKMQVEDRAAFVDVRIPSCGFLVLGKSQQKLGHRSKASTDLTLENDLVRYRFNDSGHLIEIIDKETGKVLSVDSEPGNVLTLYDDHPNEWDAWDISHFYEEHVIDVAKAVKAEKITDGPLCQQLSFSYPVGNSEVQQTVSLGDKSRRLDFSTKVDWREKHKMLRVAFPVNIRAEQATYDIQYGYIKRNTHWNTLWDFAKFEAAGHRYADLSDHDYGVALLNDCKYGYKVHGNVLDLNLLRAPTYPDPDADQGIHEFTYSLLPHQRDLIRSEVMAEAAFLNQGILAVSGFAPQVDRLPWRVEGDGLSLEVVKKAEKEDCIVLRIVETKGRSSVGTLFIDQEGTEVISTDLMEWESGEAVLCDIPVKLSLKPFEIRTYKLLRK